MLHGRRGCYDGVEDGLGDGVKLYTCLVEETAEELVVAQECSNSSYGDCSDDGDGDDLDFRFHWRLVRHGDSFR